MDVIVYRNPIEKQMWDTFMSNPEYILYAIGIGIAVVIVLILAQKIKDKMRYRRHG